MGSPLIARRIETDVLVVGGGGAGALAAVTARRRGLKVLLIAKGKVGRSGNTIMIGGGFGIDGQSARERLGLADASPATDRQILFENTVRNGYHLSDQNLVRQFAEDGAAGVGEILAWAKAAGQDFAYGAAQPGWRTSGKAFGRAVGYGVGAEPGIEVLEDTVAAELIVVGGRVVGLVAADVHTGDLIRIDAKAVVLATGGHQPFGLKNTIGDMSGDGAGLAWRAGARLSDMEFLLFLPTIRAPKRMEGCILPYLLTIPSPFPTRFRVVDALGNELAVPESFRGVNTGGKVYKLLYAYYWGKGAFQGPAGAGKGADERNRIYFDFTRSSDEELAALFENLKRMFGQWHAPGKYNKIDLEDLEAELRRTRRLEVGFGNEYSMGGVVVDARMATEVPGLYAAGEVTAGLFGAFRAADGLTEMLAHGYRAGLSIAEDFASSTPPAPDPAEADAAAEALAQALLAPFGNPAGGPGPLALRAELEAAADAGFNLFRDEAGLSAALERISRLRSQDLGRASLSSRSRRYNLEWLCWLETRNQALCSEAGVRAALERRESRGFHLRSDYPEVDWGTWTRNIVFSRGPDGSLELGYRTPPADGLPHPGGGKSADIAEHIAAIQRRGGR